MDQTTIDRIAAAVAASLAPIFEQLADALSEPLPGPDAPARVSMARTPAPVDAHADGDPDAQAREGRELARLRREMQFQEDLLLRQTIETERLTYELEFDRMERDGVVFDRDAELGDILDMAPDRRPGHIARMRTQYRRSSIGQGGVIPTAYPDGPAAPLTADDHRGIIDYATKHKISDPIEARERYLAERNPRARGY